MQLLLLLALAPACCEPWWAPEMAREAFVAAAPGAAHLAELARRPKHLVFKVGPPASGKSVALNAALAELSIAGQPFLEINKDRYVERHQAYREQTQLARATLRRLVGSPVAAGCGLTGLPVYGSQGVIPPHISELVCQMDAQAYFRFRDAADREAHALLFTEFLERPHYRNIVYEGTGSTGSYQHILKLARMARLHGFRVHVVYAMVRWPELIRRSELRALELGRLVCADRIRLIRRESRVSLREIIRRLDQPDFPVDSVMLVNNDRPRRSPRKVFHFHKTLGRRRA